MSKYQSGKPSAYHCRLPGKTIPFCFQPQKIASKISVLTTHTNWHEGCCIAIIDEHNPCHTSEVSYFMGIFNKLLSHLSKAKEEELAVNVNQTLLAQIHQYSPLIHLQDQRQLIEVLTHNGNYSYQTMIIGVDLYHQQLILDEFSPRLANPQTLVGETIVVRHQKQWQMLKITTEVLAYDADERCLRISLPAQASYLPRRIEERLTLSSSQVLNAVIEPVYGSPWYASLINISPSGMRIVVTGDLRPSLHRHKPLRKCTITLDNQYTINCQGRVKSFNYIARPCRRTEISIEFIAIQVDDKKQLAQLLEHICLAA